MPIELPEQRAGTSLTVDERVSAARQRRPIDLVRELLQQTTERLRKVRIEHRDLAGTHTRFDSPNTFFYLDPPYVEFQSNGRYEALPQERREELFVLLSKLKGSFLLSFDDCSEIREIAARHSMTIETVETRYALGSTAASRKPITELFISKTITRCKKNGR